MIVESLLNSSDLKTSDNSIDDDINIRFSLRNASSLCATSQPEIIDTAPTVCCENKDLPGNDQIDSPDFRFGNNLSPQKQPNASSTAFDADGAPYPDTQCKPASSYSDIQESVHLNADTSSNCKLDYSLRSVYSFSSYIEKYSFFVFHYLLSTEKYFIILLWVVILSPLLFLLLIH